jgi:pimeloyl-ACP methyl ester carboxylesterase
MHVIFNHGKESGPWGTKISFLADMARELGCSVESLDYQGIDDPDQRVEMLMKYMNQNPGDDCVLVGSSMGGYVALVAAEKLAPEGVFLMAPALYMSGYQVHGYLYSGPVCIVHGRQDDVVSIANSERFQREYHCELHLIDSDHRLNDSLDIVGELFGHFLQKRLSA